MQKRHIELVGWGFFTASALFFCALATDLLSLLASATFLAGCVAFLIAHFLNQ